MTLARYFANQPIRTLVVTRGEDHNGVEHTLPAGALGFIDSIKQLPAPQGVTYTVWIDAGPHAGIVNVFDESDGAITDFIAPRV